MAFDGPLLLTLCVVFVCCLQVHAKTSKQDKTRTSKFRFPDGWKAAAERDEIYGWESFNERGLYTENMAEPTICSNTYNYSRPNSTTDMYEYMICPTPEQNGTFNGCCGDMFRQRCCNVDISAIVAIIIAVIVLILVCCCLSCCGVAAYFLYYLPKKRNNTTLFQPPPGSGFGGQPPPPPPGYGTQPPAYSGYAPQPYGGQQQLGGPQYGGQQPHGGAPPQYHPPTSPTQQSAPVSPTPSGGP